MNASTAIPVIDIAPAVTGGDDAGVVRRFQSAMSEVGFLQVTGHGVGSELITAAHQAIARLDALPDGERQLLHRPRGLSRGIFERTDPAGALLQRGFQFIPYDTLADAALAGAVRGHPDYFDANVWPPDPGFVATWKRYLAATRRLSHQLMSLFAKAFGLDPGYFAGKFAHDVTLLSANWYPRQPASPAGDQPRVLLRDHPDSGVLTVLHQRGDYEGLQVLGSGGEWRTVPMLADAFVINIGELMSRWTNGQWPATIHRVVASPVPSHSRSSIATFFLPNIDEVIEPLPGTTAGGALHEPISTYDWQRQFMAEYVLARGG
jgi:isopenicillin N synthase-like dioxygenase